MRRYWIDKNLEVGSSASIDGDLFHHVFVVCRVREGQRFELLNSSGKAYLSKVLSVGKKNAEVEVLEEREAPSPPKPFIKLFIGLPRFQKMDLIVEKCVELGVKSVIPMFTENSFVKDKSKLSQNKVDRWEKIVLSATQQSGRGDLMRVESPQKIEDILPEINRQPKVLGLFPYEGDCPKTLKEELRDKDLSNFDEIWVFIGSEGGFSEAEVVLMDQFKMSPVSLGEQVLRVETACVALASIIKYELTL